MMFKQYSETKLSVLLLISSAVWGLYWIPLREINGNGIPGPWAVVILTICPLIILYPVTFLKWERLKFNLLPTILAALMIGFAFSFYANSLVETTVVRATLFFYLTPIWSTIIGIMWLSEKLTKARTVSIILALSSLFFLMPSSDSSQTPINRGDVMGLMSGVFWAFGGTILKKYPKIPILPMTTIVFTVATISSTLFASIIYGYSLPDFLTLKKTFLLAFFWSTVVLLTPFFIVFKISTMLFPGRVGLLMMAEVIVAIVTASILIPSEKLFLMQWVGAFGIISAALIEILYGNTETKIE